jgi:hypothetical protein
MVLKSGIRDPEKTYPGSRIQGSKSTQSRIPDPDPQHWLRNCDILVRIRIRGSVSLTNGSGAGSVPYTKGFRSGRSKNIRIRIRNTGVKGPDLAL